MNPIVKTPWQMHLNQSDHSSGNPILIHSGQLEASLNYINPKQLFIQKINFITSKTDGFLFLNIANDIYLLLKSYCVNLSTSNFYRRLCVVDIFNEWIISGVLRKYLLL